MVNAHNFKTQNIELLLIAEKIAAKLSIDLKFLYESKVEIREQYKELNNASKIPYEDLVKANTFGANNGFKMIVQDLENLSKLINEFHNGDVMSYKSDEIDNEIFEGKLNNIAYSFEHICKWYGNEQLNKS
tara:strand:+ start:29 stop:421 length:393 start_codon:yes stop_codon:yes gene_type:complete